MKLPLAFLMLLMMQAACTTVHVHDKDAVVITQYLGIPILQIQPNANAVVVDTQALGVVSTLSGFTVGWVNETHATVPADSRCQVIIWPRAAQEIESVMKALEASDSTLNNICVTKKKE